MRNSQHLLNYFLPIAFLLLLALPFINDQTGIWKFERSDENRAFKDSLSIDLEKLDYFPKEAESYLSDNFSFRTPLLDLYQYIKYKIFNISPHPDQTIIGKEGWFFLAKKDLEIYEGKWNFSNEQLDHFLSEWQGRKNYMDSMGIKTYWLIAPYKHYVYSEKLPFNVYHPKVKRVDQLKTHFETAFPNLIIYPLPALLEQKSKRKLFYKLDNHWNYHAGYLATQMLLEQLRADFPLDTIPSIPDFEWKTTSVQTGIHYNVIKDDDLRENRQTPVMKQPHSIADKKYGFEPVKGFPYPQEYELRYTNKTLKSGLKILFIRDSFAGQMIPFVNEICKESVYIFDSWRYQLNRPIIETVKPDIVVYLMVESNLEFMLKKY